MRKVNKELAELQEKFRSFYNQNLGDKFEGLETSRQKHLHFFWKWLIIFIVMALSFFYLCIAGIIPTKFLLDDVCGWLIISYILIVIYVLNLPLSEYKNETKQLTMDKILSFFGDFKYKEGQCTQQNVVKKSGLFKNFDNQIGDDFFVGTYKGVQIQVSEEKLTKRIKTNKGSYNVAVFKGIIIILEMNKNFSGQTVVRKDWGLFNFLMAAPLCQINDQAIKLDKVKLEDSVFEKQFEVFSHDQVEARYLLTTAFIERILEIKKRFHGKKIQFSFFDNKLLLAINTSKDMFEPTSLFSTTARYGLMREVVGQFYSIFSTIDVLKLNQRLGL